MLLTDASSSEEDQLLSGSCTRSSHCDPLVFGKGIRLTVTPQDPDPVKPNLFILSPLQPEDSLGPEVCLATGFRPKVGEMVLNVKGGPLSLKTSDAVLSLQQKTYFYAGFTNQTVYSCELNHTAVNNHAADMCADLHPENAKLNFLLLLMNGVRVVFTKAVAFSTILTINAVLAPPITPPITAVLS